MPDVHRQVGDGHRRCERCGTAMPTQTHRQRADDGRLACPACINLKVPDWTLPHVAAAAGDHEEETERIRERRGTDEARAPHDFRAAEWTHGSGHPRCRLCGDEERTDGRCAGADHDGLETSAPGSKGTTVAASLTADENAELRRRLADAQRSILDARPRRRVAGQVLDARAELARRHLVEAHGWSPERVAEIHDHHTLRSLHRGLMDAGRAGDLVADPPHDEFGRPVQAARKVAHESPDDTMASHCCFCGSGQLVGLSDGSIECGYCQRSFTVRIQPSFPSMPQTTTGLPPDPGAAMMGQPPAGALPPGAPSGPPAGRQGAPQQLVGPDGRPMPPGQYMAALAARHGLVPEVAAP